MASLHAEGSPPTKPGTTDGKHVSKLTSLLSPRQPRAHSADYSLGLAYLTRRAAVHLALLEGRLAANRQELAPSTPKQTPTTASPQSRIPDNLAKVVSSPNNHKNLATQLMNALEESGISDSSQSMPPVSSTPSTLSVPPVLPAHPPPQPPEAADEKVFIHESFSISNPFSALEDLSENHKPMEVTADHPYACKRKTSEESSASDRSSRERTRRNATPKRAKPDVRSVHNKHTLTALENLDPHVPYAESTACLTACHLPANQNAGRQDQNHGSLNATAILSQGSGHQEIQSRDGSMEPGYVFKKVPHRANRKLGIPIVIRAAPGGDLRKVNPKILHHDIVRAAGEVPSRIKFANTGAVTVDVISEAAATRLLATTAVGGVQVDAQLPAAYRANTASIRGIPTTYTDEALLGYLEDQGVIRARRRFRKTDQGNLEATDEVILYFRENTTRPAVVDLGFWVSKVRDFTEAPPRCFRCQRYGHIAKRCLAPIPRCSLCGRAHDWKECTSSPPVRCVNCGGEHAANFSKCPTKLDALRRARLFVTGKAQPLVKGGQKESKAINHIPSWTGADFPALIPGTSQGNSSYAGVASRVGKSYPAAQPMAPHPIMGQQVPAMEQLALQQRQEMALIT